MPESNSAVVHRGCGGNENERGRSWGIVAPNARSSGQV